MHEFKERETETERENQFQSHLYGQKYMNLIFRVAAVIH